MPDPFHRDSWRVHPKGRFHAVHFSGGQSSAYMLHRILEANGGLPDDCCVIFTNTGLEHPHTLDFVHECGERWQVPITWLEYWRNPEAKGGKKDPIVHYKVVDRATASLDGTPFKTMIDAKAYLPNPVARICTVELKIETARRFIQRDLRHRNYTSLIGIRGDESRRVRKALLEHCEVDYPMVHAATTRQEVLDFWRTSPFRLDLPEDGRLGNCVLCFLKEESKLLRNIREEPERAEWYRAQEKNMRTNPRRKDMVKKTMNHQFNKRYTYDDLVRKAKQNAYLPFKEEEVGVDCFCGD